jgi:hypothetical protein
MELYERLGQELARRRGLHERGGYLDSGAGADLDAGLRAALEAAGYLQGD